MNKPTEKQLSRLQHDCSKEWEGRFPPEQDWLRPEVLNNFTREEISEVIGMVLNEHYERATIALGNNFLDYENKNSYDPSIEADVDMVNQQEDEYTQILERADQDYLEGRMYL